MTRQYEQARRRGNSERSCHESCALTQSWDVPESTIYYQTMTVGGCSATRYSTVAGNSGRFLAPSLAEPMAEARENMTNTHGSCQNTQNVIPPIHISRYSCVFSHGYKMDEEHVCGGAPEARVKGKRVCVYIYSLLQGVALPKTDINVKSCQFCVFFMHSRRGPHQYRQGDAQRPSRQLPVFCSPSSALSHTIWRIVHVLCTYETAPFGPLHSSPWSHKTASCIEALRSKCLFCECLQSAEH
jgi:hypothetical protein